MPSFMTNEEMRAINPNITDEEIERHRKGVMAACAQSVGAVSAAGEGEVSPVEAGGSYSNAMELEAAPVTALENIGRVAIV